MHFIGVPPLAFKGRSISSANCRRTRIILKIGDAAPDFSLKGVDGKIYSLADFKDAPVLMVIFLSDHCPYSHAPLKPGCCRSCPK